jgi:putative endonuclease
LTLPPGPPAPDYREQTGKRGEALARAYLEQQGYQVIAVNWRCPHGEIDLIVQKEGWTVFVEVRTRRSANTESAFGSITPGKRTRLLKAVHAYLDAQGDAETPWRVDVIAVALSRKAAPIIEHVEDALDWSS